MPSLKRNLTIKKSTAEKTTLKRTKRRSTKCAVLSSSTKQNTSKVLRSLNYDEMKDNFQSRATKIKAICSLLL